MGSKNRGGYSNSSKYHLLCSVEKVNKIKNKEMQTGLQKPDK